MQGREGQGFVGLVGDSAPMRELRRQIACVAPLRSTVLLSGETGVGKGVAARMLHHASPRRRAPFVHADCASLAPQLAESELFGHERGAFTGAVSRRSGRFERAAGGTIFLDEVGELAPSLQVKLLRILQDREFERLGSDQTLPMNARVVAATSRDLGRAVRDAEFRADLYFRLNVIRLAIPPLRERTEDIPLLVRAGLDRLARELELPEPLLLDGALARLRAHSWPGNVRELLNVLERLFVRHAGHGVGEGQVGELLSEDGFAVDEPWKADRASAPAGAAPDPLERIASELRATGGNVARTARRLGLPRSTLRHWIRRHGLR